MKEATRWKEDIALQGEWSILLHIDLQNGWGWKDIKEAEQII